MTVLMAMAARVAGHRVWEPPQGRRGRASDRLSRRGGRIAAKADAPRVPPAVTPGAVAVAIGCALVWASAPATADDGRAFVEATIAPAGLADIRGRAQTRAVGERTPPAVAALERKAIRSARGAPSGFLRRGPAAGTAASDGVAQGLDPGFLAMLPGFPDALSRLPSALLTGAARADSSTAAGTRGVVVNIRR